MPELKSKNSVIREVFEAAQDSFSTHPQLVKKLRKYYDSNDQDRFFESFIFYLRLPISGVQERSHYIEKVLEFVAKFACSFLPTKGEEKEESEDELPLFLYRLFVWLLDHHAVEGVDARLRVCQLLNKLLKYMGDEACIDDDLYNKVYFGMLDRLKDRVADIRSQAVTALQRLQDPKDEDCPIIKSYLFHLTHDPNSVVRKTIVRCIGATRLTLPHILERTRDVDEGVRRAAYKFLAEKVHIKSLTIGQREGVLQRGLKERSEAARKVVEKELISSWLRLSNHNIIQLLHHLDVGNSEQNFKAGQQTSAPSGALEVLFSDLPFQDLISNFQYLDAGKLIPLDKLTPETALYWRVLVQFLSKQTEDEHMDSLRPELSPFCDYVRIFVLSLASQDDDLNWEFIAKELIIMCSFYDLGDEVGRKNLTRLIKDLLISERTSSSLIPQLVYIFTMVEKSAQSRIDQIAEVIAELKDPMSKEPVRMLEPAAEEVQQENIDHKLVRSLQLEIAKIKVDMSTLRDDMEAAISTQDFLSAQQIKQQMTELEAKRVQLEESVEKENGRVVVVQALIEPSVNEDREDPAITLKCLKLLVATLQDPSITQLNATLHTLLEELVVVSVQSEMASIRKEAITALACFCLRSIEDARMHMLLLLQAAHIDVPEVRIAAITAVIDLLMRHGLVAFITTAAENTEAAGELSETSSSIENALESDMATRGASLTQSELNTQGGNSVVAILSKMLDEPDLELRTEVAEGLCKLLMIGAISSPKLLSRLLLMWYNPMTESDSKLRHILGTFFPLYSSMNRSHQEALEAAFIPSMKVLFDAPITSPLAEIDVADVGLFLVHLTREDMLQNFEAPRTAVSGECTVSSVHDALSFSVCNEILSAPDSYQTKTLVKILTSLQITHNNYVSLRELKVLSEQLLKHVKEKQCLRSLEKFDKTIQDWLARDPSKAVSPEKRPAAMDDTAAEDSGDTTPQTSGKKKRFLFSQTILGNPLLEPEDGEEEVAELRNLSIASPRRIPSPVVNRGGLQSSFNQTLNSTISRTKILAIRETAKDTSDTEPVATVNGTNTDSEEEVNSTSQEVPDVPSTPDIFNLGSSSSEGVASPTGSALQILVDSPKVIPATPSPPHSTLTDSSPEVVISSSRRARETTPTRSKALAMPSSPGISRSGRRNSPRIDYRTGRELTPSTPPTNRRKVATPTNKKQADKITKQLRVNVVNIGKTASKAAHGAKAVPGSKEATPGKAAPGAKTAPGGKTAYGAKEAMTGKAVIGSKTAHGGKMATPSITRKRGPPSPSAASRNSSPAVKPKTPRSKTPSTQLAVKGVRSLRSGQSSDSDSPAANPSQSRRSNSKAK